MTEGKKIRRRVVVPRQVLLVEVERYCPDIECNALTRTGLTKEEARTYTAFTCARCERTWDDSLGERDIPDWWEELQITSLEGVRALVSPDVEQDPGEVVARMSDAWRARAGGADADEVEDRAGDSARRGRADAGGGEEEF